MCSSFSIGLLLFSLILCHFVEENEAFQKTKEKKEKHEKEKEMRKQFVQKKEMRQRKREERVEGEKKKITKNVFVGSKRLNRKQEMCGLERREIWSKPNSSVLLFQCRKQALCGGLGDVLRGIVSVVLFSLLDGNHLFSIVSEKPDFSMYYDFPSFMVSGRVMGTAQKMVDSGGKMMRETIETSESFEGIYPEKESYIIYTNGNFVPQLLKNKEASKKIEKYFKSSDPEIIRGCVLRFLFRPRPNLIFLASSLVQKAHGILIGIHIRAWEPKFAPKMEEFVKLLLQQTSSLSEPVFFFLAADSPKVVSFFSEKIPSSSLILSRSLSTSGGTKEGAFVHTDKCGTCVEAHERAVVDHFVLSRCDSLIIARSGYSESAAMFGNHYQAVKWVDFAQCVKGRNVSHFLERDSWSRLVPRWSRSKCDIEGAEFF